MPGPFHRRISIHPPREGWDPKITKFFGFREISIHPPREGWDLYADDYYLDCYVFQSTHPVRGGTSLQDEIDMLTANFNPPTP